MPGPNRYALFVKEKIKTPEVQALPPKQRFKKCAELWKEHKAKTVKVDDKKK